MSTLAKESCASAPGSTARVRRAARACGGAGGADTISGSSAPAGALGALLERTVRELRRRGRARCPVCSHELAPDDAHPGVHGRCRGCGTAIV